MLTTNCRFPRLIKVGLRLWPTFVLFDTRLREWVTPAFGAIVVAALVRQASIASEQQTELTTGTFNGFARSPSPTTSPAPLSDGVPRRGVCGRRDASVSYSLSPDPSLRTSFC